ncbi:hypothetical protein HGRIS_013320 [Hohenbuehelia grisea]|uniref:Major facilitator superfamily (MFS) profile domain-containing protein n=1 Tax=Hohenbuehelia grisea TaxID=104357 RepID=A0ABR3IVB7_9AGAR
MTYTHPISATSTVHGDSDDPSHPSHPTTTTEFAGAGPSTNLPIGSARYRYPEPEHVKFAEKVDPSNSADTAYPGNGTPGDPFIVDWDLDDPECPYNWTRRRKWLITTQLAMATWTVSFGSSSYSGGLKYTISDFRVSEEVAVLGVSLYVVGFALGPLVFAPLGETFGRRIIFLITFSSYLLFNVGCALSKSLPALLICRFLSGTVGSSPLTNSGGTISDIWNPRERGLATAIYATVPFLGPVIGPIVGGFVSQNPKLGWHFNFWLVCIVSGITLLFGYIVTPETYTPVLLRRRARKLTQDSGSAQQYTSVYDLSRPKSFFTTVQNNLRRPFLFLFTEPIVALLAGYVAIVYGTLYAQFSAFPIIFQQHRGFSPGEGGLAFLGVGLGVTLGTATSQIQNRFYWRAMDRSINGRAPPEARLHMSIVGGILLPVGLFWFAWTTQKRIHFLVPIFAGVPFGVGVAQILQGLTAYLMDTYGIFFASAIAATVVLRSFGGAAFPLVSPPMFRGLGDQWAMSIFAFMSLACMPLPILFFKYGGWIRSKSAFAYHDPVVDMSFGGSRPETATSQLEKRNGASTVTEHPKTSH